MDTVDHVVREGETLEDVARFFYGDASRKDLIAEVNGILQPAVLRAGEVLKIPTEALFYQGVSVSRPNETTVELRLQSSEYVNVPVSELLFPGTQADAVPLANKWVYAISEGRIAFVVDARGPDDWYVQRREAPGPEHITSSRLLLLRAKPYRFLLSPIQLSPACEQRLVDNLDACRWLTTVDQPARVTVAEPILLRDPFQWAVDVHDKHFRPKLAQWQEWLADEARSARRCMAHAFQAIVDQGDTPGIANQLLDGQPQAWIRRDELQEREHRQMAEVSAHYLASWIDSEDHRIIEAAHVDAGVDATGAAVVHWACVVDGLGQVFEGRQLLSVVISDPTRVPMRFVLSEVPQTTLAFGELRYLSLAARGLATEMGPAIIATLYPNNPPATLDLVKQWFERFGEKGLSKSVYRQVQKNIKMGRKLSAFVPPKQHRQIHKLVQTVKQAWQETYQPSIPRALVASERLAAAYERNLGKLDKVAFLSLETLNLAMALYQLADAQPGSDKQAKFIGMLGAGADAGNAIWTFVTAFSKGTRRAVSGVLGIVSGVCDWYSFTQGGARAVSNYDYNQAFGQGIAMAGTGFVVGAGLGALASAAGAAGGASWLAWLGWVGGALIAVGAVTAALLTDNPYEELAKFSFLGENGRVRPEVYLPWCPVALPDVDGTNPAREVIALLSLVSGFEIELKDKEILMIFPKFHRPGDVIELYFEANYGATSPNAALIEVDLESGDVVQTHGIRPLQQKVEPTFNADGVMTSIRIDLREIDDGHTLWFKTDLKVQARIRLQYPGQPAFHAPAVPAADPESSAPKEPWTEVRWTAWGGSGKASSADAGKQIDRLQQPVREGMRALTS